MAESTNKKNRVVKKSVSVREKASQAKMAKDQPKKRRLKSGASKASKPFSAVGSFIAKILRPLGFLLIPFKTKPARFVGRILAKIFAVKYFINSAREIRLVTWPNARETTKLTIAVFIFALVFSGLVAILDYGLDKVFQKLLLS